MPSVPAEPLSIAVAAGQTVGALLQRAPDERALFVFAHGAGAGIEHPFMTAFADGLAVRGVSSLRYRFPYVERGSRRPDTPAVAQGAVRAAVAAAARVAGDVPLVAGGKSYGGRMTSLAQAAEPLPRVAGLAFVGFPLHPAGKPGVERARHLSDVALPMLFLQGTRDDLAPLDTLRPELERIGPRATLVVVDDADHAFHVRVRSGRTDEQALASMLDAFADWVGTLPAAASR